mmetsp:Transcript_6786/g.11412  ORF Transcript_6786/g.11412 Transcript_6786/m.11412 type:complete len:148 (-) Transcript_6786:1490-1933(-)
MRILASNSPGLPRQTSHLPAASLHHLVTSEQRLCDRMASELQRYTQRMEQLPSKVFHFGALGTEQASGVRKNQSFNAKTLGQRYQKGGKRDAHQLRSPFDDLLTHNASGLLHSNRSIEHSSKGNLFLDRMMLSLNVKAKVKEEQSRQ